MVSLYEAGYGLYVPFGENTRWDLTVERKDTLLRVQCKTGRLRSGAVRFGICRTYAHHPNPKMKDVTTTRACWQRVDPPKNNQNDRVRWARDYEIGTVAIGGLRAPSGA